MNLKFYELFKNWPENDGPRRRSLSIEIKGYRNIYLFIFRLIKIGLRHFIKGDDEGQNHRQLTSQTKLLHKFVHTLIFQF